MPEQRQTVAQGQEDIKSDATFSDYLVNNQEALRFHIYFYCLGHHFNQLHPFLNCLSLGSFEKTGEG